MAVLLRTSCFVLIGISPLLSSAQSFEILEPDLNGATRISGNGSVIAGTFVVSLDSIQAFRWQDGLLTPLEDLPGGPFSADVDAISLDGRMVAGWSRTEVGDKSNVIRPAVWVEAEAPITFELPPSVDEEDCEDADLEAGIRSIAADTSVFAGVASGGVDGDCSARHRLVVWNRGGIVDFEDLEGIQAVEGVAVDPLRVIGVAESGPLRNWFWDGQLKALTMSGTEPRVRDMTSDGLTLVGYAKGGTTWFRATIDSTGAILNEEILEWAESDSVVGGSVNGVSDDGEVIIGYARLPSNLGTTVEAAIWTQQSGLQLLDDFFADLCIDLDGWKTTNGVDISADGRFIIGTAVRDGERRTFRAEIPRELLGKGSLDCECSLDVFVLTGEGEFIDFDDASNWDRNQVPGDDDFLTLPLRADTFVVTAGHPYGALEVQGDAVLLNSLDSKNFQLLGPCGEALVISGRNEIDGPGSFLEIQAAEATIDGAIVIPGRPDSFGNLALASSLLKSEEEILVDLGNFDSYAEVDVEDGGEWITPSAEIRLHAGAVTLVNEARMEVATLTMGISSEEDSFSLLEVEDNSIIKTGSLIAGARGYAGLTLSGNSSIEVNYFETSSNPGASSDFLLEQGSLLEAKEAVIGKRDTSLIDVRESAFLIYNEALTLGEESGGAGTIEVEGFFGSIEESNVFVSGEDGDGTIILKEGATGSVFWMIVGMEESGFGLVEVHGQEGKEDPDLRASLLEVGVNGEGVLQLFDGWVKVDDDDEDENLAALIVGSLRAGEGTLELNGTSDLEVNKLVVGQEGRGDLKVMDDGDIDANLIIVGDSLGEGGFGSMNVSGNSFVSANGMCVGCIDGVGLLGVIQGGSVHTNFLQVGQNGSVSGNVATVMTIQPSTTTPKRSDRHGIVTGALYLAAGAKIDVDTLTVEDGILGGTYTWPADFTNTGTLSPGNAPETPGNFTIAANYTQTSNGTLDIDLGGLAPGDEHDVLSVTGTAELDGVLRVGRIGGYVPKVGDRYQILSANGVTGAFSVVEVEDLVVSVDYERDGVLVEVVSTVNAESEPEIPARFAMETNYPNPFSGVTAIPFALPEASHVRLTIYDMYGRMVDEVPDGLRSAGRHEVIFDASSLASGTYLYRLEAGSFHASRRMVVVQ
jgi:uncharacterized membrane protein